MTLNRKINEIEAKQESIRADTYLITVENELYANKIHEDVRPIPNAEARAESAEIESKSVAAAESATRARHLSRTHSPTISSVIIDYSWVSASTRGFLNMF